MKITICTGPNYPVPAMKGGGMARAWHRLGQYFASKAHQVTIVSRAFEGLPAEEMHDNLTISRRGGFDQCPSLIENLIRDFGYAFKTSFQIPKSDVLVLNDFWLPAIAPLLRPSLKGVVVSVNRIPKNQYKLYSRSDTFVCPTNRVSEILKKQLPHRQSDIFTIANPYDSTTFSPSDELGDGLLYVGRIHPEKGLDILLNGFGHIHQMFPDLGLTIVGPWKESQGGGGSAYFGKLKERSKALPVRWLAPVYDPSELRNLYHSHRIFCYPSISDTCETMGIAPVEAMACGCIPIVSNLPVFNSFLAENESGLSFDYKAHDAPQKLASLVRKLLSDPQLQEKLRQGAIASSQRFSIPKIGDDFLTLFTSRHRL
ncbi:MAG: glycosyltransferase family 4 protein [Verrucomicrobiota bacterium]